MDAEQAIADLTEISPQVKEVVVIGSDGAVAGSNAAAERAAALAEGARKLLDAAGDEVAQLEAATATGSLFVVRDGDRAIAAVTSAEPTVGLVFYDLKTCLRSVEEPKPKRPRKKKADDAAA